MEPSNPATQVIPKKRQLLWVNCLILAVGTAIGPLIMRLYYIHGGKRIWLQSFLQSAGFPIMIIPTVITSIRHLRGRNSTTTINSSSSKQRQTIFLLTPRIFLAAAGIGIVSGLGAYLYARGLNLIPVSTSSLILSTQLGFTAVFCFLLVKQKFTSFSVNAVVLLILAAVVLATGTSSDRPAGENNALYYKGFFMTLGVSALFALMLPLIELTYVKSQVPVNYSFVLQMQLVLVICATIFCVIGMFADKDFQAIPKEARAFELGEAMYYVVLIACAIIWQFFYIGAMGVIYFGSSLLSGIIIAICLPITEILAVIFFKEKFQAQKGVSLALSIWGFVSYFYGEFKLLQRQRMNQSVPGGGVESKGSHDQVELVEAA